MNNIQFMAVVWQVGVCGGIGAGFTYWLLGDAILGAIFGIGVYLASGIALLGEEVMEVRRELQKTYKKKNKSDFP